MPDFAAGIFDPVVFYVEDTVTVVQYLWWGPLMPDAAHGYYALRGPMYPDYAQPNIIPPIGPGGVVSLGIDLEQGAKITLSWVTDIIKSYSGLEQRISIIDEPKVSFNGNAILVGTAARIVRAALAKNGASGLPFLLGLPYEEMTVTGFSGIANRILVTSTAGSDWATVYGQRILIVDSNGNSLPAVIQTGSGSNYINVDIDVSSVAHRGSRVMPQISVLLEPQQGFARSATPDTIEQWQVRARALDYGFRSEAQRASSPMGAVGVVGFTSQLGTAYVKFYGPDGNGYQLTFLGDLVSGSAAMTNVGNHYTAHFVPDVTRVSAVVAVVSSVFTFSATFINIHWIMHSADEATYLFTGGVDKSIGLWGNGGIIETYANKPLWDRYIQVENTADDSAQTMVEILDFDGVPQAVGQATVPDWGRAVMINRRIGPEWQWLKAFLYHVRGRQKSFWLSTFRDDLEFITLGNGTTNTMIISSLVGDGDFFTWYPKQRSDLQVWMDDDTFVLMNIHGAVDNNDGTATLECRQPAPTPQNASITFTSGHLGANGYTLTKTKYIGTAGNIGSIEIRGDGTGGDPVSGGGVQISASGHDYVAHIHPGNVFARDVMIAITLSLISEGFVFTARTASFDLLDASDVQGPIYFTNGVDVGTLGALIFLPSANVKMVSWLELCRFESDDFEISFEDANFSMAATARVVQR